MKVLFVGNSHTYFNDMPHTFARLCAAAGTPAEAVLLAHSGQPLAWHLNEYFELRYNLLWGGYDFCVIQQQAHPFPGCEATREPLERIAALCRAGGAQPVLVTSWAERRAPEHQAQMSETMARLAAETGALAAPVGEIWQTVRRTHPEIELFWRDGEHASPLGDYLVAVTLAALLTGTDARQLPTLGADFARGAEIDFFAGPRVIEDPAAVETALDETACAALREAVAARLGQAQSRT